MAQNPTLHTEGKKAQLNKFEIEIDLSEGHPLCGSKKRLHSAPSFVHVTIASQSERQ